MPLLEGLKADELMTYWKDCQIIGFGESTLKTEEAFYEDLVPARLAEVVTPLGVKAYQRLQLRRKAA